MSEKIEASVLAQIPQEIIYSPEQHGADIAKLVEAVNEYLKANHIDPEAVLFSGYDPGIPKSEGSEHWETGSLPYYFLGDARSLLPPTDLSDDPETQGEHWMVNPLNYAIIYGTLGIFDKSKLGEPVDHDQEFGTYAYETLPQNIDDALIAQLHMSR